MPKTMLSIPKFHGLYPAINRNQAPEVGVIRGKNFRFSMSGPYSGWGNKLVIDHLPFNAKHYPHYATFDINDQTVLCSTVGIFMIDGNGHWHCVIKNDNPKIWNDNTDNEYPWTKAFVGDSWFFAHPTFGLAGYSVDKQCWYKMKFCTEINNQGQYTDFNHFKGITIAEPVYSITQANNRLILLAADTVSWSEIDNGYNFTADIHTGTGFQNLSINEYGKPLAVTEHMNGFNVFTSNGLTAFISREDEASFHAKHISRSAIPISPYAVLGLDNKSTVYLTKLGLFMQDSAYVNDNTFPKEWEPIVGKWLAQTFIPRNKILINLSAIRMFYFPESQELFISMFDPRREVSQHTYTHSLVFNASLKEWASFDQRHTFIGPINFTTHRMNEYQLGFIANNSIHQFDHSTSNSGQSLDSRVELGLFTVTDNVNMNLETELQEICIYSGPSESFASDRNFAKAPLASDQYAEQSEICNNYNIVVASTPDGYTVSNEQWEVPYPININFYSQNYNCNIFGKSHIIALSAEIVGQFYELSRIDLQLLV
jgi:hypothetical protein